MSEMKAEQFSALFKAGRIGNMNLKNRLIMGAMGNALADSEGNVTEAMLHYYRARAEGGVGLVITQFATVNREDPMPYSLALYDDKFIPGLRKLVDTIHAEGTMSCIQLMHPGMLLLMLRSVPKDQTVKVPTITPRMAADKPFHVVTEEDLEYYVKCFAEAAQRVKETGADAVELHACHGCLISTFMSPATNHRTDQYGGTVKNRTRFAREALETMRKKLGKFPVLVRINGTDDVAGGVTTDDVIQEALILESAGADAISISSGLEYWSALMAPSYASPEGVVIPVAAEVKKAVKVPVITAGKIPPVLANQAIKESKTDFTVLGRPLLADPELPEKLLEGRKDDVFQCIYCNNCLNQSWPSCTVNPFLFRESTLTLQPAQTLKNVMVVGGGLAGMQAAAILATRGHKVTLYEKTQNLGGQWSTACRLPDKQGYSSVIEHLKYLLGNFNVPAIMGVEVNRKLVLEKKPDVLILATGAIAMKLDVPGADNSNVVQANDVLDGKVTVKGKVAIIGGRMLGMEMAVLLAEQGKEVILVSRSGLGGKKGPDEKIAFRALMRKMIELRIPVYLNAAVLEITGESVIVRIGEEILSLPTDTVVLASGVEPDDKLAKELEGAAPQVYSIGDCMQPGNAAQATFSATRLALKL